MIKTGLIVLVLLVLPIKFAFAKCPYPMPDKPAASQIIDCIEEFQDTMRSVRLTGPSDCGPPDFNCTQYCERGEIAISGSCIIPFLPDLADKTKNINSGGNIQNFGVVQSGDGRSGWHCLWRPDASLKRGQAFAYCMKKPG